MEMFMKEILKTNLEKEKEFLNFFMEIFTKGILKMVNQKEKEFENINGNIYEDEFKKR